MVVESIFLFRMISVRIPGAGSQKNKMGISKQVSSVVVTYSIVEPFTFQFETAINSPLGATNALVIR